MARVVNREPGSCSTSAAAVAAEAENDEAGPSDSGSQRKTSDRRILRSRYHAFKTLISDKRDDILKIDSNNFCSVISEVENLHQLVQKPREQVADAEALLDITNSLVTSVKAHGSEGVTPSDLVNALLRNFSQQGPTSSSVEGATNPMHWKDIGVAVSHVFRRAPGCCTMLGPMDTELKQRKVTVHRKRTKPTESAQPEELDGDNLEKSTDTDKNMMAMFDILRKNRKVKLENLVLNRNSFPQTVENIFALSFLVKDGRAEISLDEEGCHLVSPRNAPAANAVASKEVAYNHFVFRFDYNDWKLMKDSVKVGEELMVHRQQANAPSCSPRGLEPSGREAAKATTPIRKLSRNRGLVIQERAVVEDSPESEDNTSRAAAIRRGKRKLR